MANCSVCGRKLPGLSLGKRKCVWCMQHEAAQRGELPDDAPQPMMPAPWQRRGGSSATLAHALVGINIAVYVVMGLSGGSLTNPSIEQLIRFGANYGPQTFGGEWWRLITYCFLHGGLIHIAFNMWCLWDIGALCESLYGTWTFGAVYLISGVAGGLASAGFHPERPSVGASGAIFGLAGALIAGYSLGEFSMPKPMVQAHLRSLVVFVGYNILIGAVSVGTDNLCHLGGLVAGLFCGALIARVAPSENDVFARLAILGLAGLSLAGITVSLERSRGYLIHERLGKELLREQKYDAAIGELQAAVRMRPNDVPARLSLASAYYTGERYPQAEGEAKRALTLDPENDNAAYILGFAYLGEKKTQQAKDTFAKLIAKDGRLPGAHYGFGMALSAEGDDQKAVEEYKTTAKMRPEFEGVHYRMGVSQSKLKLYDDAIASFEHERDIGDDSDNEAALADAYEAKGLSEKAAAAHKRAEELKGK